MTELRTILSGIAGGVLVSFLVIGWHTIRPVNRIMIILLAVLQMTSAFTRSFLYKAGVTPAPGWYLVFVDLCFIAISITLITSIWMLMLEKRHVKT